jgi:hypothetical protein
VKLQRALAEVAASEKGADAAFGQVGLLLKYLEDNDTGGLIAEARSVLR